MHGQMVAARCAWFRHRVCVVGDAQELEVKITILPSIKENINILTYASTIVSPELLLPVKVFYWLCTVKLYIFC